MTWCGINGCHKPVAVCKLNAALCECGRPTPPPLRQVREDNRPATLLPSQLPTPTWHQWRASEYTLALQGETAELRSELARLRAIIDTPHTDDFIQAVSIEAEHQRQRWGAEGDAGKTPADWFWLLGYLSGKALAAFIRGDQAKGLHHIISTAAALKNWHLNATGKDSGMRPGIETPSD